MNMHLRTNHFYAAVLTLLTVLMISSCVSVKLGDTSIKKSSRYSFESPNSNFRTIKDKTVDSAWMHRQSGSTLSIRSKCQKGLDIDLTQWLLELSEGLNAPGSKISVTRLKYNARDAAQAIFDSQIEGYDNKLAITTFVKNSCHYIIALTSLAANFDEDLPEYKKFLQGFKAW